MASLPIDFDAVLAAERRLAGVVHRTPLLRSSTADARSGATLLFKAENLQRTGAFKLRGAFNAIACFTPAQRRAGVVTFSSGNHGQAIALAARLNAARATVVMPADAPDMKRAATLGYGAEVVPYDRYREDPLDVVRRLAQAHGLTFVPPFDHPDVMAGQGTAALELAQDAGALDMLVTPVGGGGLLAGCAVAARAMAPGCAIVGVEPQAGNDAQRSLAAGRIVRIDTPATIADAAQSRALGSHTFAVLQHVGARIVTVSDDELVAAMRFLATRMKLVVEPTGCLGVAAVLGGHVDVRGLRVGIVLSGGNVDLARFAQLVAPAAATSPGSS